MNADVIGEPSLLSSQYNMTVSLSFLIELLLLFFLALERVTKDIIDITEKLIGKSTNQRQFHSNPFRLKLTLNVPMVAGTTDLQMMTVMSKSDELDKVSGQIEKELSKPGATNKPSPTQTFGRTC